ncbi:MAG: type II toxin-antitoxin system RelE/ParE family toxin [Alphaproteobacteria bacterium]|nr:type II toxin-antitoxin system RelE/ParE family toxin [Alphaproteobacteria bacterium SS10]
MKTVMIHAQARKALRKMAQKEAEKIRGKIDQYAADPSSLANNVKRLRGDDEIRLRVGDWRVVMRDGEVLDVLKIGPRGSIYK